MQPPHRKLVNNGLFECNGKNYRILKPFFWCLSSSSSCKMQIMKSNRQGERVCCRFEGLCLSLNPPLFKNTEKICLNTYWRVDSHLPFFSPFRLVTLSRSPLSHNKPLSLWIVGAVVFLSLWDASWPLTNDSFHFFVFVDSKSSNLVALSYFFFLFLDSISLLVAFFTHLLKISNECDLFLQYIR